MAGFTNRGKKLILDTYFRGATAPANFYLILCTSAVTPTADTNTQSELTQITGGTGYTTNGVSIARNSTDFDTMTEDDTNDWAQALLKDIVWTASGGNLGPARWAVLVDDNATPGSRQVIAYFDLGSDRTVSDTQTLTLVDCTLRGAEA